MVLESTRRDLPVIAALTLEMLAIQLFAATPYQRLIAGMIGIVALGALALCFRGAGEQRGDPRLKAKASGYFLC